MLADIIPFLRSTFFYLGYYIVTIFTSLLIIILFPLLPEKGRYYFSFSWCSFILGWLRICCGVRYKIDGKKILPSDPHVIIANHQSEWETILFYKLVFPVSPILKQELLRIPFWGWAMKLQKPIAIDRSNPREASKSLMIQGVARLKEGRRVFVFPEGTRSKYGSVKRFSRGGAKLAIAAQVPVVPIAHNAGYCWPPKKYIKRSGLITVVIGESIPIENMEASPLTDEVEEWIRTTVDEIGSPAEQS